jgi:hypothetical protein
LTGGNSLKFDWAPLFGIGVAPPPKYDYPAYKDIWNTFKEVHKNTISHISSLTDEQLNVPSRIEFAMITDVRGAIQHCIRHEGTHIGHLGWLENACHKDSVICKKTPKKQAYLNRNYFETTQVIVIETLRVFPIP